MYRSAKNTSRWLVPLSIMALAVVAYQARSLACPFCAAVALTMGEEMENSDVVAVGKLVNVPVGNQDSTFDVAKATFEVVKVYKGQPGLVAGQSVDAVYFGDGKIGSTFLMLGVEPPEVSWGTPIPISERGIAYLDKVVTLPKEGPDRLAFFQEFLEDADESLARDAYDEFAKVPYSDVRALAPRMQHDRLLSWIKDPQVPASRRRLYLTMIGLCGKPEDVPVLEEMIKSKDRQARAALDALVACYLTLKGPDGMSLVEDLFLKDKKAEYTDTYATIIALRFHGTEETIVPRERLLTGIRYMLDRPELADLVIPDLARWEDWSAMPKLVELFKNADEESSWVRVPVVTYLRACPLPEAKKHLEELARIDPETVKRAEAFYPFGGAAAPAPADSGSNDKPPAKEPQEANDSQSSAIPMPPSSAPVYGGLAAAAAAFGCAFWVILRGGQQS